MVVKKIVQPIKSSTSLEGLWPHASLLALALLRLAISWFTGTATILTLVRSSLFKLAALAHQICLAHLLRELNHINECYKLRWATDLKELFVETIAFKKTLLPEGFRKTPIQITEFEKRLTMLIREPINEKHLIALAFQNPLVKYRQHIFTFLYYEEVPPENNGSERAIRNVKVKQKISGQFKSFSGAETFAILRSVIDTALKNKLNPLNALSQINSITL